MSARAEATRLRRWHVVTGFVVVLSALSVLVGISAARGAQSYYSSDLGSRLGAADPTSGADASHGPRTQDSWPAMTETSAPPTLAAPAASSATATPDEPAKDSPSHAPAPRPAPGAQEARTAAPATTSAPPAGGRLVTFTDLATSLCLDSSPSNAYTMGCNNGDYQKWTIYGFGQVLLIDKATGLCLTSNTNNLNVYPAACDNDARQLWTITAGGPGMVNILNVPSGLCLDSNIQGALYTQGCNDGDYQRWKSG